MRRFSNWVQLVRGELGAGRSSMEMPEAVLEAYLKFREAAVR